MPKLFTGIGHLLMIEAPINAVEAFNVALNVCGGGVGRMARLQLAGAVVSPGWKGAAGGIRLYSPVTFCVGYCRMFSTAATVSRGAVPPGGVASENSFPQFVPSPALPPVEFTHDAITSPKASICPLEAV